MDIYIYIDIFIYHRQLSLYISCCCCYILPWSILRLCFPTPSHQLVEYLSAIKPFVGWGGQTEGGVWTQLPHEWFRTKSRTQIRIMGLRRSPTHHHFPQENAVSPYYIMLDEEIKGKKISISVLIYSDGGWRMEDGGWMMGVLYCSCLWDYHQI